MAYEVEGKNIRLLPDNEQIRVFRRFESFLTGLEFHLQFLSHTEHIDHLTAPPLLVQKEALSSLSATPHIQALQRASIRAQERQMTTCTRTANIQLSLLSCSSGSRPQCFAKHLCSGATEPGLVPRSPRIYPWGVVTPLSTSTGRDVCQTSCKCERATQSDVSRGAS